MFNAFNILKRNYQALNRIEVSFFTLRNNYKYLSLLNKNIKVAPVLKSNAYGHGINELAKKIDTLNAPFLCVDSLFEAYELLKRNVKTKILIMGYIDPVSLNTKKLPFSFVVYDKERIDALNKYQSHAKIHIFVDTGMHREGVDLDELPNLLKYITLKTKLEIEGLMSHLAKSEDYRHPLTRKQVENFNKARKILEEFDINPKWVHLGNSSALLNHKRYGKNLGNIARTGLSFYGIDPEGKNKKLKPSLKLMTHISQIKALLKGQSLGYDFTFTAKKNMKIAVLPIGYFDGIDRRLSNNGVVSIKKKYCQIIGRVSMNITVVDISNIKDVRVGDQVIIFSNNRDDKNSIENASKITIPYDFLVHLSPLIKRVFV